MTKSVTDYQADAVMVKLAACPLTDEERTGLLGDEDGYPIHSGRCAALGLMVFDHRATPAMGRWIYTELGGVVRDRIATLAELRIRTEARPSARRLGVINDADIMATDFVGWLVLANVGEHVLEIRKRQDEWAHDAAARGPNDPHAYLVDNLRSLSR